MLFSCQVVFASLRPHGLQHTRPPCPLPSPRVCPSSCSFYQWCRPAISSSDTLFFCPQSFPASGSFQMSHLFTSGGQNIGVSALASVLPVNIQGWSPLRLTGLISLLSKGLWRVFSSTTVRRHQFFGVLPSLWSSSHNRTWPLGTNWVKQCVFLWRLLSSVWGTAGAVKEYIVCTHCVGMCLLTLAVPVPRARRTVANIKDYTFWNYLFFFLNL